MEHMLSGKTGAILITDGFEQVEFVEAKEAPEQAGAVAHIVSPNKDQVKGGARQLRAMKQKGG